MKKEIFASLNDLKGGCSDLIQMAKLQWNRNKDEEK